MNVFYCEKDDDLKAALFDKIKADLAKCPDEFSRVLLAVPAQTTLSMEEEAFERIGGKGFLTLNVVSGAKLRADILNETGGSGKTPIDSIGRNMLLRRVIQGCEGELQAFSGVCKDPDFIAMAADFIVQMKQNRLTAEDVSAASAKEGAGAMLQKKLHDMALISSSYQQGLAGQLEDSDDLLSFTAAKTAESEYIRSSKLYFYGFYSFTENETEFLKALDARSAGLEIALLSGPGEEFEATRRTVSMLGARTERIPSEGTGSLPETEIVHCANPYSQAESIAARITGLMRTDKNLRFSDIAILVPGSGTYGNGIRRVLEGFGIPVFMDETRGLLHSRCIDLLYAVLQFSVGEFRSSDIINFVRSGILEAEDDVLWNFENYIKQFHIQGKRLAEPLKYKNRDFSAEDLAVFEELRAQTASLVVPFADSMAASESCREKTGVLRSFLQKTLEYPEYLEKQASLQAEWGLLEASEETRQIWGLLEGLFDQAVQLLGDVQLSPEEFRDMLLKAVPDIKEGVLPQAEDSVQIGNIRRSILQDKKVIFVAGFCEGQIPSEAENHGILSDKEISFMSSGGYSFLKPSELLMKEEIFMIFRSLSCAGQLLWIGIPASGEDGSELKASPFLDRVRKRCASFTEKTAAADETSEEGILSLIEGKDIAKNHLAQVMRDGLEGAEIPDIWKAVYDIILPDIPHIRAGLQYRKDRSKLSSRNVRELYEGADGSFSVSPSGMDVFASCPFKYFMQYGLNAKVPKDVDIASDDIGNVYHEALLRLSAALSRPSREQGFAITDPRSLWMTVSKEQIEEMLSGILEEIYETSAEGRFRSSAAEVYRSERMRRVCTGFALNMVRQVRAGRIDRMYFETAFGRRNDAVFPPIKLETAAGTVYIEGKIDRVDEMPGPGDSKYIKIIDYKSGSDVFDKELVEKGLKLQLMTYLEGALGGTANRPAGVYYFKIKEDTAKTDFAEFAAGEISDSVAKTINDAYKLDGVNVDELTAISDLDTALAGGSPSTVANISWAKANEKTGEPAHFKGDVISEQEMEDLRAQFMANITALNERLFSGDAGAVPVKAENYDSCKYCRFSGICLKDIA